MQSKLQRTSENIKCQRCSATSSDNRRSEWAWANAANTNNGDPHICWSTYEGVANKLEGYLGNWGLNCPKATNHWMTNRMRRHVTGSWKICHFAHLQGFIYFSRLCIKVSCGAPFLIVIMGFCFATWCKFELKIFNLRKCGFASVCIAQCECASNHLMGLKTCSQFEGFQTFWFLSCHFLKIHSSLLDVL